MSAEFPQVRAVLDRLLKAQFVTTSEAQQAEEQFRLSFLTLPHRDGFVVWLKRYLGEMESNDEFTPERVSYFRAELESLYDKIPANFSMYHITGLADPRDRERSLVLSDALDDSFTMPTPNQPLLMGPSVSESLRPTIVRVLTLLAAQRDRERASSARWLTRWRLASLAHSSEETWRQAEALLMIQKFTQKTINRGLRSLQKILPASSMARTIDALREEISLMRCAKGSAAGNAEAGFQPTKAKFAQESTLPSTPRFFSGEDGLIAQLHENRAHITILEEQLAEARKQAGVWLTKLNAAEQRLSVVKGYSAFGSNSAANTSLLSVEESGGMPVLSKTRYLDKTLQPILQRLKASAFLRLGRRASCHQPTLADASDRLKARMLLSLRNAICGQDLRKTFLRWMVKADSGLVSSAATKLAVNAKMSPYVAVWRLRFLHSQSRQPRMSQAARNARQAQGFEAIATHLHQKHLSGLRGVFDLISQRGVASQRAVLRGALRCFFAKLRALTLVAFRGLRSHQTSERKVARLLEVRSQKKLKKALLALQSAKKEQREVEKTRLATQILLLVTLFASRTKSFVFAKLCKPAGYSSSGLAARLIFCFREKCLRSVYLLLQHEKEVKLTETEKVRILRKASKIAEGSLQVSALQALAAHAKNSKKRQEMLTKSFKRASASFGMLILSALCRVRSARVVVEKESRKKKSLLLLFERRAAAKTSETLARLKNLSKTVSRRLSSMTLKKSRLFGFLVHGWANAQSKALSRIRIWKMGGSHQEAVKLIEQRMRGQEGLRNLANELIEAKNRSLKTFFHLLQLAHKEASTRQEILTKANAKLIWNVQFWQLQVISWLRRHNSQKRKSALYIANRLRLVQADHGAKLLHHLRQGASILTRATVSLARVAGRAGSRVALHGLRFHCLFQLTQKRLTHLALERVAQAAKGKKAETAHQLRFLSANQRLMHRLAASLLRKAFDRVASKQLRPTLSDLVSKSRLRDKVANRVIRGVENAQTKHLQSATDKLRAHSQQQKEVRRQAMLCGLPRFVQRIQRRVISHLRGKQTREKLDRLSTLLSMVELRSKRPGLIAIRRSWHIARYRSALIALGRVVEVFGVADRRTLHSVWKSLVSVSTEENPWFRKTINIWVLLSKTSVQNSFWRLRYGRTMKQHALSPEATLRLKKLIFRVQKEVQKNLNFGFWKLHSVAALGRQCSS